MSHNCGSTCRRKIGARCVTCRRPGTTDETEEHDDANRGRHANPREIGAAVDMFYDGLSYRKVSDNMGEHFNLDTGGATVHRWVQDYSAKAVEMAEEHPVKTGREWVADEVQVELGGRRYWLFNVMDADSRFVLAAHLAPERTPQAAQAALEAARRRSENPPAELKTDTLDSYEGAVERAFPNQQVRHVVSQGIRERINNNLSERLQRTLGDANRTLRTIRQRDTGQRYIDGLVLNHNYFRPHMGLDGKTPADQAGADAPFDSWSDVVRLTRGTAR